MSISCNFNYLISASLNLYHCSLLMFHRQTDNEEHAYLRVQRVKGQVQFRRRPKFYGMLKAPRIADCSSPVRAAAAQLSEFDKCLQRARAVDDANNRASASLPPRQFSGFTASPPVLSSYSVAISAPLPCQFAGFTEYPPVNSSFPFAISAPLPQAAWNTAPLAIDWCPSPQLVLPTVNGFEESMVDAMDWTPEPMEWSAASSSQFTEMQAAIPVLVSVPVSAPLVNFVDTTPDMEWEASPAEVVVAAATAAVLNQQPVIVTGPVQNMQSFDFSANSTVASAPATVAGPVNAAIAPPVAMTITPAAAAALPRVVAACRKPRPKSVATAVPVAVAPIVKAVVDTAVVAPRGIPTYFSKPMPWSATSVSAEVASSVPVVVAAPPAIPTCPKKPISSAPVVDEADEEDQEGSDSGESSSSEDAVDGYLKGMGIESSDDEDEEHSAGISWTDDEDEDEDEDDDDESLSSELDEDEDEDDEDESSSSESDVAAGPSVVSSGPAVAGLVEAPGLLTSSVLPSGPAAPRKIKAMPVRRR